MTRWLVRLTIVAVAAGVVLALTFPTAEVVRWALAQVTPADTTITFRDASLRPWGLRLDGVDVRGADGGRIVAAEWLRLRPSFFGLFGSGLGRPWHVGAGICLGTVDGSLDGEDDTQVLDVAWEDVDLGTCLPLIRSPFVMSGRSTGTLDLRILPAGPESGTGELHLRAAAWQPPLPDLEDVMLHIDTGTLLWTLASPLLTITDMTIDGPELAMQANGTVRLHPQNRGASTLRLEVTMTPKPGAPAELRELLGSLPRRGDGHHFVLVGTPDAPLLERPAS